MNYNLNKIITQILVSLTPRQRDIIQLRYGLRGGEPRTLAAIGNRYGVTRERIRQIETHALRAVQTQFEQSEYTAVRAAIKNYLEQMNGVRACALFALDWKENHNVVRCVLETNGGAQFHPEDKNRYAFWSLSPEHVKRATAFINELVSTLKVQSERSIHLPHDPVAQNYIAISKKFAVNPHGQFGLAEWRDINPKVSRDWAFMVLKKFHEPLHFLELTKEINKLRPNKKVNAQTIHNELIKDKRFILVGRGIYGLEEFNILPGTAREVLTHLLKKHGPLPAKDIVKIALTHRPFKEKTLLINLQNKNWFKRLDEGKYFVKKV